MDTWVHQMIRARCGRRVAAWGVVLGCAILFALAEHRYVVNFVRGPFDLGQAELDSITDVSTAPRYFVRVRGSKAIDTGIQKITTRKRGGVETSRSVSAAYYVLVVGDRLLVVKGSEGTPTIAEGELMAMPVNLQRQLVDTARMEVIRGRFYPYYLDSAAAFRSPSTRMRQWGHEISVGATPPQSLGSRRTGSVNVKVEPRPGSLCTQILPPWSSTNFRERASPSPVPSALFSAAPTCRNSSNTAS